MSPSKTRSDCQNAAPAAAATSSVRRILYLGGLGETGSELSEHLSSRREVEQAINRRVSIGRLEDFDLPPLTPDVEMPRLPHQVPVLLEARNPKDYDSALAAVGKSCPASTGFTAGNYRTEFRREDHRKSFAHSTTKAVILMVCLPSHGFPACH